MWESLKELKEAEFDYIKLVEIVSNDKTSALKKEEVVALSRTAAFYNSIKGLIESKEADVEMLQRFFGYNYTRFWNPAREKLEKNSKGYDKRFFQEIPELLINIDSI